MNGVRPGENSNNKQRIHDIMSKHSHRRKVVDKLVTAFSIVCILAAVIPLGSILLEVTKNGASAISIQLLTEPPGAIGAAIGDSGGIAPAIQGTLIVVGLASIIGIPIGVLTGIYLSEYVFFEDDTN
jgi:phosphate transport system permease protein